MPAQKWPLTDVGQRIYLDKLNVSPRDGLQLPGSAAWSVEKYTLQGGVSSGVDVVEIDNGRLKVAVLPTRGMGLWRGSCDGLELGWESPVLYPVHPAFVNVLDRSGLGWLRGYNEWMSRCGLDSNGAPGTDVVLNNEGNPTKTDLTLHGRIANLPAHFVELEIDPSTGTISLTGIVDEAMLFGPCLRLKSTLKTVAGSNRLSILDEVINLRSGASELELLYHTNFGAPLLEAGARMVAPIAEVAPRDARAQADIDTFAEYLGPTAGYIEQVYWCELLADPQGETQVLLRNAQGDKGVSLHFNTKQLPCFTLWKNTAAASDGYVTGLEAATNFPNLKTVERQHGRVVVLQPGQSYQTRMEIAVHTTGDAVREVEHEIVALQQPKPPRIHRTPQAKYSATK